MERNFQPLRIRYDFPIVFPDSVSYFFLKNIFFYGNIRGCVCHALKTAPQKEASEQVSADLKEQKSLFISRKLP